MFIKVFTKARQSHSNARPNLLPYSPQIHFDIILPSSPTFFTRFLLFPFSEHNWISFQISLISYLPRHLYICYWNSTSHSSHTPNVTSRTAFNLRRINSCLFLSRAIARQVAAACAVHIASWQHNSAVPFSANNRTFNGYSWRLVGVTERKIVNLNTVWLIETSGSNRHYWASRLAVALLGITSGSNRHYWASRLAVTDITEHHVWQ